MEVGAGVSFATPEHGGLIIGISRSVGFSPPGPSGNINWGSTDF